MSWNKDKIRELRLRRGWSQSELARHLQCPLQNIEEWESGNQAPNPIQMSELDVLGFHVDEASEEMHSLPLAENILDNEALNQIDFSQVKEQFQ